MTRQFPIGGAKVRKQAAGDKVTVVGGGRDAV